MLLSKLYVYSQRATVAEKKMYMKETTIDKSDKRKTLALTRQQYDLSRHPITAITEISSTENKTIPTLRERSSILRHSVPIMPTHHSAYQQQQEGSIENVNTSSRTTTANEGKSFDCVINSNTAALLLQDCSDHISTNELKYNNYVSDDTDVVATIHIEEGKDGIIPIQQSQYHSWKESLDIIADVDTIDMAASNVQKFMNTNKSSNENIMTSDPSTGHALWPSAVLEQVRSSLKRIKLHSKQYNKYLNNQPLQQRNILAPIASKPLNNINSSNPLENNNDLILFKPKFLKRARTKLVAPINHRNQIIKNKPHYFCDNV